MGNIVTTLKRFISNKNTITILGVLLGLVVLFIGYNYRVSTAVEKVSIPYAKKAIGSTLEITSDSVGQMEVLRSMVTERSTLISSTSEIINTTTPICVAEGTSIAEGSFFYKDQIKKCEAVSNNAVRNMPDGYRSVSLPVDLQSTYGNSMYPGDYIDIYVKMESDDGKLIYGEFVTKLPILDVRDSNGVSVFYGNQGTNKAPALLLFAVPQDMYLLLAKAVYLGSNIVQLVPVPGNSAYTSEKGETRVTSEWLRERIRSYTQDIPDAAVN